MLVHVKLSPEEKAKLDFLRSYLKRVTPPGVPVSQTAVMRWALDVAFMAMLREDNPEEYERRVHQTQREQDALVPCNPDAEPTVNTGIGGVGEQE